VLPDGNNLVAQSDRTEQAICAGLGGVGDVYDHYKSAWVL